MQIIQNNPNLIFSYIELEYIGVQNIHPSEVLELMDIVKRKDLNLFENQYKSIIAVFLKQQYSNEWLYQKMLEDLQILIEMILNIEDRQEQHTPKLAVCLNLILGSMNLWCLGNQLNCYRETEQLLLKLIKMSLKIVYIPIKKVMFLFYILLSRELNCPKSNQDYWLRLKEYQYCYNRKEENNNNTELFYKRLMNNQDDNQIGQIIVVGLLRALVKTASSVSNNQQGVEIHREWEEFYFHDSKLTSAEYAKFKETTNHPDLRTAKNKVIEEFDRHRIITNFIITEFFLLLLRQFRNNCKVQCSYLIQLITDANGVLVFLKFFEKFNPMKVDQMERCVSNLVKLLYITCNNYPEKINNFLIDYKEYLAIKKFPGLFPDDMRIKKYSHLLLKIQILNFNKKNLKMGNTMKLISEVYCKYQPKIQKTQECDQLLDSLYKFEKCNDKIHFNDIIQSQEELRKLHAEYNNHHYWNAPIHLPPSQPKYLQSNYHEKLMNAPIEQDFILHYEQWLDENVFDYYD